MKLFMLLTNGDTLCCYSNVYCNASSPTHTEVDKCILGTITVTDLSVPGHPQYTGTYYYAWKLYQELWVCHENTCLIGCHVLNLTNRPTCDINLVIQLTGGTAFSSWLDTGVNACKN